MREISKVGNGGYALTRAHTNPPVDANTATSRWSSFGTKSQVQQALLNEQYGLCCYSELRCDEEGLGYHIEHVKPKSKFPAMTFDYANLAASGLASNDLASFKAQGDETFGGHYKGNDYEADFVSCHDAACSTMFSYLSDGRVVPRAGLTPTATRKALHTIKTLNLNSPYLKNMRKRWWDELDELLSEHVAKDWSLPNLASIDLVPSGGKLSRFFSLTRQFFGPIAEQTLADHAPALV